MPVCPEAGLWERSSREEHRVKRCYKEKGPDFDKLNERKTDYGREKGKEATRTN